MARINMGIAQVNPNKLIIKRQFRYLFEIEGFLELGTSDNQAWAMAMTRPNVSFDLIEVRHVQEVVSYPSRVKYEPIEVTLIDVHKSNEIYDWLYSTHAMKEALLSYFDVQHGIDSGVDGLSSTQPVKRNCSITLYDGMGDIIETWKIEGAFVTRVNFGPLDVTNNSFATIELTIQPDRVYITDTGANVTGGMSGREASEVQADIAAAAAAAAAAAGGATTA